MTTQRDLLAAALHDAVCPLKSVQNAVCCDWHEPDADALLARGVRVVTPEKLAWAIHEVTCDCDQPVNSNSPAIKDAVSILAAIDEEAK